MLLFAGAVPLALVVGRGADIFAEAVADVMGDDPMVDENTMPPQLAWDGMEEKDTEENAEGKGATAEVKFNGTPLKGVLQKDKNGGMKMTVNACVCER